MKSSDNDNSRSCEQFFCLAAVEDPKYLCYSHKFVDAGVAQLVEQLTCNQQVGGSIPFASSCVDAWRGQVAERLMAADCKSAAPCGLRRFESSPVHKAWGDWPNANKGGRDAVYQIGLAGGPDAKSKPNLAHVAQLVERVLGKDEVTSSILVVGSSAGVTQWLESRPSKPLVAGSNPVSRSFVWNCREIRGQRI